MANQVETTVGMKAYMIDPDGNSGAGAVIELKRVTGFNFAGSAANPLDATTFDSEDYTESVSGLKVSETATLSILFSASESSHQLLMDLYDTGSKATTMFCVGSADGTALPTVDSEGKFNFPTSRSFMAIEGWVQNIPFDVQVNNTIPIAISIQRTGPLIKSFKTP